MKKILGLILVLAVCGVCFGGLGRLFETRTLETSISDVNAAVIAEINDVNTSLSAAINALDTNDVNAAKFSTAMGLAANTKIVYPGDNLQTAYNWLKSSDRNAQMGALSATNRRALVLAPGRYSLTTALALDTDYVDVLELSPDSAYIVDGAALDVQLINYDDALADVVVTPSVGGIRIPYADLVKPDKLMGPEDVSGDMVIDASFGDAAKPYVSKKKWPMNDITGATNTRIFYTVGAGFTKSTDPNHYITASNGIDCVVDATTRELATGRLGRWHDDDASGDVPPTIGTNDSICHVRFYVQPGGTWCENGTNGTVNVTVSDYNEHLDGETNKASTRAANPGIAMMGYFGDVRTTDEGFATVSFPMYDSLLASYAAEANLANPLAYFKLKVKNDTGLTAAATLDEIWWTKDLFRANSLVGGVMIFM
ncbi:MAG: hypothetical protein PHP01_06550, partial [Phycisphaerae bacterium]|nr:hypothetical protein [Phycisphaerae bacterium]